MSDDDWDGDDGDWDSEDTLVEEIGQGEDSVDVATQLGLWTEPPVLDLLAAEEARDEAMGEVEEAAEPSFNEVAFEALERVAQLRDCFIVDAVWEELRKGGLIPYTHDKRAMGPIMSRGQREGLIEPTGDYEPSAQVKSHAGPRRVWRSLVRGAA